MDQFLNAVKEIVRSFRSFSHATIKLVSHLDADGLSSSAIMISALQREGLCFSLTTIRQIDDYALEEIKREHYSLVFFLDLGSGSLRKIDEYLKEKEVFILDHHSIESYTTERIHLLNPLLYGIDGNSHISGAGVCYLFAKALNPRNMDLAHIALLGAIGDMQESNGFSSSLNSFILDDAVSSGKIEVKIGLRMFGMQTRPLDKMLEYTADPYIPGVSGSGEGARAFIEELGIDARLDGKYKKLVQLKEEDMKRLITGIILRRLGSEERPDDVLGKIYLLNEESDESPMRDAKEFSTLLNACGRLHKPAVGIGSCLRDPLLQKEAIHLLTHYKREIIQGLNWFYAHKDKVLTGDGYAIINAGSSVRDTMIGTLASILSKNNMYREGTVIISFAYTLDGYIKISARSVYNKELDLREMMSSIVEKVGGICGGHSSAAGALIRQDKEEEFIKTAVDTLNKLSPLQNRKV